MIYVVLSGYRGRPPAIILPFSTKEGAKEAVSECKKYWPCVQIMETEEGKNMIAIALEKLA